MRVFKKLIVVTGVASILLAGLWYSGASDELDEVSLAQNEIGILLDSQMVDVGSINLHVVFAGPENGEPVILIHGFPEFWYMWRYHIKTLANQGYRVAAIDMRGYNRSDKPKGRASYSMQAYASDITGLMDAQGWSNANIVSHDIGSLVAWELIFDNAERVKRAAIFSGPHPLSSQDAGEQSETSWYRSFFRLPLLPELASRLGGLDLTAKGLIDSSRPGTFSEQQISLYKNVWMRDHAYYSMLGAYRNQWNQFNNMPANGVTAMPVMYINGLLDKFVPSSASLATKKYLGEENVHLFPELTHWLLAEEPELTASEIISFLQR
ncbi:MAG: pimeloyl-ACP methyl ester carboxylesterase [Dinoroseobacter sp.]|jgi:pimeloyl-ACP methyl ester carboxylesterase